MTPLAPATRRATSSTPCARPARKSLHSIRSIHSRPGSAGRRTTATTARSPWSTAGSASPAASTSIKPTKIPQAPAFPPDGDTRHAYWRDDAIRIEGPAVAELQKLFFGTWREQKAPPAGPGRLFPATVPPGRADDPHHRQLPRQQAAALLRLPADRDAQRPPAGLAVQRLFRARRIRNARNSIEARPRRPRRADHRAGLQRRAKRRLSPPAPPMATCWKRAPTFTKCGTPSFTPSSRSSTTPGP